MSTSSVAIIPIKAISTRVPEKNFRMLGGKKLYEHIIEHTIEAECFDAIYIDTDSDEIKEYAHIRSLKVIDRLPWLASDEANGNDLLVHEKTVCPPYDLYFQLFATAPFLKSKTIAACVTALKNSQEYDSVFTATLERGWYWMEGMPVNFRPGILPRSQDARHPIKETTGLYGITNASLERYHCRIGRKPYAHIVEDHEAVDLDTEEDFKYAEYLLTQGIIK